MRAVALLMVMSGVALADLGPQPPNPCAAYDGASCRQCFTKSDGGAADAECVPNAMDAGFSDPSCSLEKGGGTWTYYCQQGDAPKQGCSSVMLGAPLALAALFGAWRSRKRA